MKNSQGVPFGLFGYARNLRRKVCKKRHFKCELYGLEEKKLVTAIDGQMRQIVTNCRTHFSYAETLKRVLDVKLTTDGKTSESFGDPIVVSFGDTRIC